MASLREGYRLLEDGQHQLALEMFLSILNAQTHCDVLNDEELLELRNVVGSCYTQRMDFVNAEKWMFRNLDHIDSLCKGNNLRTDLVYAISRSYRTLIKVKTKTIFEHRPEDRQADDAFQMCGEVLEHLFQTCGEFEDECDALKLISLSIISEGFFWLATRALDLILQNNTFGEDSGLTLKLQDEYAFCLMQSGKLSAAEELLKSLLGKKIKRYGKLSKEIVHHNILLANFHFLNSKSEKGIEVLEQGLSIFDKLEEQDFDIKLKLLLLKDQFLHYRGHYDDSKCMQQDIREVIFAMLECATNINEKAMLYIKLGKVYRRLAEYELSIQSYEEALQLDVNLHHKENCLIYIGFCLKKLRKNDEAEKYLRKVIDLLQNYGMESVSYLCKSLFELGSLLKFKKNYKEALKCLKECTNLHKHHETFVISDMSHSLIHTNIFIAQCLIAMNRSEEGIHLCQEILPEIKEKYGNAHPFASIVHCSLSRAYLEKNKALSLEHAKFCFEVNEGLIKYNRRNCMFYELKNFGDMFHKSHDKFYQHLTVRLWKFLTKLATILNSENTWKVLLQVRWFDQRPDLLIQLHGEELKRFAEGIANFKLCSDQQTGIILLEAVAHSLAQKSRWDEAQGSLKILENMMAQCRRPEDEMRMIKGFIDNVDNRVLFRKGLCLRSVNARDLRPRHSQNGKQCFQKGNYNISHNNYQVNWRKKD